jgi:hypothetical protein
LEVHGIRESELEVELVDMCGTPIETDRFKTIMKKYITGDSFFVELNITSNNVDDIILSQVKKISFCHYE